MAVDADGAALLVVRYVAPCALPPALAGLVGRGGVAAAAGGVEGMMLKAARFVAHVRSCLGELRGSWRGRPWGRV
jgi:coiled-coil and C2 domain-containing protein 2A